MWPFLGRQGRSMASVSWLWISLAAIQLIAPLVIADVNIMRMSTVFVTGYSCQIGQTCTRPELAYDGLTGLNHIWNAGTQACNNYITVQAAFGARRFVTAIKVTFGTNPPNSVGLQVNVPSGGWFNAFYPVSPAPVVLSPFYKTLDAPMESIGARITFPSLKVIAGKCSLAVEEIELYVGTFVDCEVTAWSDWTTCSALCGAATRNRTREIVTAPNAYGDPCPTLTDEEDCGLPACVVDCVQSPWSIWSECSAPCGSTSIATRTRTTLVSPTVDGRQCGPTDESTVCAPPCPSVLPASINSSTGADTKALAFDGNPTTVWESGLFACSGGANVGADWKAARAGGIWLSRVGFVNTMVNNASLLLDILGVDGLWVASGLSAVLHYDEDVVRRNISGSFVLSPPVRALGARLVFTLLRGDCSASVAELSFVEALSHDCVAGDWTPWSTCLGPCGNQTRVRTRPVVFLALGNGANCTKMYDTLACITTDCPLFVAPSSSPPSVLADGSRERPFPRLVDALAAAFNDTTIILLPGTHVIAPGTVNVMLASVVIASLSSQLEDSGRPVITCKSPPDSVTASPLVSLSPGAKRLTLQGIDFVGCNASALWSFADDTDIQIYGCRFALFDSRLSSVIDVVGQNVRVNISDCAFESNAACMTAGVRVSTSNGSLTLARTTFLRNVMYDPTESAECMQLFVDRSGESGSEYLGGTAVSMRGEYALLTVSDCHFDANGDGNVNIWLPDTSPIPAGGAICAQGAICELVNCTFSDNVIGGYGGAVFLGCKAASIIDSRFMRNAASGGGGGLAVVSPDTDENVSVLLERSSFQYNGFAQHSFHDLLLGGAVYIYVSSESLMAVVPFSLRISYCEFANNGGALRGGSLGEHGGALYVYTPRNLNGTPVVVEGTLFRGNHVTKKGGAVFIHAVNATLTTCTFIDNGSVYGYLSAEYGGGGLYADWTDFDAYTSFSVIDCNFTGNSADSVGGAAHFRVTLKLWLIRTHFGSNSAASGGSIAFMPGQSSIHPNDVVIVNCSFTGNIAATGSSTIDLLGHGRGGAVLIQSRIWVWDTFGGMMVHIDQSNFDNNTAAVGGAIALFDFFDPLAYPSLITMYISQSEFRANHATESGGAISMEGRLIANVTHSLFSDNHAPAGGAVFVATARMPRPVVFGACFFQRLVVKSGGVTGGHFHLGADSTVEIYDGVVSMGSAEIGGCFFVGERASVSIWLSNLSNCSAKHGGGFAAFDSSSLFMYDTAASDAVAQLGGWIYAMGQSEVSAVGIALLRGAADYGGCLYLCGSVNVTVESSTFTHCISSGDGGALSLNDDATVSFFDAHLLQGLSTNGLGGCLACQDRAAVDMIRTTLSGCASPSSDGGSIATKADCILRLRDTAVRNSVAFSFGGGVLLSSSHPAFFDNVTAVGNMASVGGFLCMDSLQALNMSNSYLSDNSAVGDGGAIAVMGRSSLTLSRLAIMSNSAGDRGGGIVLVAHGRLFASHSIVGGNQALLGGGLSHHDSSALKLVRVTLVNNFVQTYGGAIFWEAIGSGLISNSTIIDNRAGGAAAGDGCGGGIAARFRGHSVNNLDIVDSVITGNNALSGGGIYSLEASFPFEPSVNALKLTLSMNKRYDGANSDYSSRPIDLSLSKDSPKLLRVESGATLPGVTAFILDAYENVTLVDSQGTVVLEAQVVDQAFGAPSARALVLGLIRVTVDNGLAHFNDVQVVGSPGHYYVRLLSSTYLYRNRLNITIPLEIVPCSGARGLVTSTSSSLARINGLSSRDAMTCADPDCASGCVKGVCTFQNYNGELSSTSVCHCFTGWSGATCNVPVLFMIVAVCLFVVVGAGLLFAFRFRLRLLRYALEFHKAVSHNSKRRLLIHVAQCFVSIALEAVDMGTDLVSFAQLLARPKDEQHGVLAAYTAFVSLALTASLVSLCAHIITVADLCAQHKLGVRQRDGDADERTPVLEKLTRARRKLRLLIPMLLLVVLEDVPFAALNGYILSEDARMLSSFHLSFFVSIVFGCFMVGVKIGKVGTLFRLYTKCKALEQDLRKMDGFHACEANEISMQTTSSLGLVKAYEVAGEIEMTDSPVAGRHVQHLASADRFDDVLSSSA